MSNLNDPKTGVSPQVIRLGPLHMPKLYGMTARKKVLALEPCDGATGAVSQLLDLHNQARRPSPLDSRMGLLDR